MTVFGFGRPGWQDPTQHSPPLSTLPARFTIGLAPTTNYDEVASRIHQIESIDHNEATHPDFHQRQEPKGNGMMLIPMNPSVREIKAARIYLELWGGHPLSDHRRMTINGRTTYPINVPAPEQCMHVYRDITIKITDLVRGQNAVQFAVDGDSTFWGHFIVEEAAIDALLPATSPEVQHVGTVNDPPKLVVEKTDDEAFAISLPVSQQIASKINAVHFYAMYDGFDENGDGVTRDWNGFTKRKVPTGHLASVSTAPYSVRWDTSMMKSQSSIQVKAVVEFIGDMETTEAETGMKSADERYWKAESLCWQSDVVDDLTIEHPAGGRRRKDETWQRTNPARW